MSVEEKSCTDCTHGEAHPDHENGAAVWCRCPKSPRVGSFAQPDASCQAFAAKGSVR